MPETAAHDHELEVLEEDQAVPPRPEEQVADVHARAVQALPQALVEIEGMLEAVEDRPLAPGERLRLPGTATGGGCSPVWLVPSDSRRRHAAGGTALPAGVEVGWGAVGSDRDDVSDGVIDPPGTRGSTAQERLHDPPFP